MQCIRIRAAGWAAARAGLKGAAAALILGLPAWGFAQAAPAPGMEGGASAVPVEAALPPGSAETAAATPPAPAADGAAAPASEGAAAPAGPAAAETFLLKCMACHTIGGGALTGPDLKPSTGWPREQLRAAIQRMEAKVGPIPEAELDGLTDLLLQPDVTGQIAAAREAAALKQAASLEPGNAALGRALYFGRKPFSNGGISCGACHQAGGRGGNLASSLEDAFTRIGEMPLVATCESPGYPVMRAMYTPRPITKQEAVHVVKFLEEVSKAPQQAFVLPLHAVGLIGAAGLLYGAQRMYRKRAGGTRARMVTAAMQKTGRGK